MIGSMLDPVGAMIGQGFAEGFGQGQERRWTRQDIDRINQFFAAQTAQNPLAYATMGPAAMMMGPQTAQPPAFPTMRSPFGQALQAQYMQSRLAGLNPLNPLQDAERQKTMAEAKYYDARTKAEGTPEYKETDPRYWLSQNYKPEEAFKAARVAAKLEAGPTADKPVVWKNNATGETRRVGSNEPTPQGKEWEMMGVGGTTVNVGTQGTITQATRSKLEDQVIQDSNFANSLEGLVDQFKPAFLELGPSISGWIYNQASKVEDLRKLYPGKDQEFYSEMAGFKQMANQVFNEYRKVITGAQAGMPEIQFLRQSAPTTGDAPDVFEAKSRIAIDFFRERSQRYQQALESDKPLSVLTMKSIDREAALAVAGRIKSGEYGNAVQKALGVDPSSMSREQKIQELRSLGATTEEIMAAMKEERDANTR